MIAFPQYQLLYDWILKKQELCDCIWTIIMIAFQIPVILRFDFQKTTVIYDCISPKNNTFMSVLSQYQ